MMVEQARVVAIDADCLWVETGVQAGCGSCSSSKSCGSSLLAKLFEDKQRHLRVPLEGRDPETFSIHDVVEIGMSESAIMRGSLVVYLLPLAGLMAGAMVATGIALPEGGVVLSGLGGFALGLVGVRLHAWWNRANPHYQPVLVGAAGARCIARSH